MTSLVRVFVNARPLDVSPDATVLDAVRGYDPEVANLVVAGERALTDSRGLPLGPEAPVYGGLILRVVSGRGRRGQDEQ